MPAPKRRPHMTDARQLEGCRPHDRPGEQARHSGSRTHSRLASGCVCRRFGELPPEDHLDYLKATDRQFDVQERLNTPDGQWMVGLLRDGMAALVSALAVVTEIAEEAEQPMQ